MDILARSQRVNIDNFDPSSDDINPAKIYEIYKKNLSICIALRRWTVRCAIDRGSWKKMLQFFKIKMKISKRPQQSWTMFDKSGNQVFNF